MKEFSQNEMNLHRVLDRLSNREPVEIPEELIKQAVVNYETVLRKQLTAVNEEFRLRMSNIGRPVCQLQREKAKLPRKRMDYNHIVRMMIGDSVEVFIDLLIRYSNIDVTGGNDKVKLKINDSIIKGTDDIELDNEVWDIKTCSPFAFDNKWSKGWDGIYENDDFGYVDQLYGYAKAKNLPMGGWIVINKSTGEVKFVKTSPTKTQLIAIEKRIEQTEDSITNNKEFIKCFTEEEETYYGKDTGNTLVPRTCTYCSYMNSCWPDAVLKPKAKSKAKNPIPTWYANYKED